MNREEKQSCVAELKSKIMDHEFIVITKNHGLTVTDITDLRRKVFALGDSGYQVAKNTLLKLAAEGTHAADLVSHFMGPTAIAFGQDAVSLAKVLVEFTESNEKITLLAGLFNGRLLSDKEIQNLSKMPSLPELLAQVVAHIQGLGAEIRRLILAPATEIHRILTLLSEERS